MIFSNDGESLQGPGHGSARFFPGSTIGNLLVSDAVDLLRAMAATLGAGSMLLIGIDSIKSANILLPAYDDAHGVTAAFNLNLLHRINRELSGTVPVDAFSHVVRWNDVEARIEMHLKADRDAHFLVDGRIFSMANGETIHTENSFKYDARDARVLLLAGGWIPIADWTDQSEFFSVILAKVGTAASAQNHVSRRAIFRVMHLITVTEEDALTAMISVNVGLPKVHPAVALREPKPPRLRARTIGFLSLRVGEFPAFFDANKGPAESERRGKCYDDKRKHSSCSGAPLDSL